MRVNNLIPVMTVVVAFGWVQAAAAQYGAGVYNPYPLNPNNPYLPQRNLPPALRLLNRGDPAVNWYMGVGSDIQLRNLPPTTPPAVYLDALRFRDQRVDDGSDLPIPINTLPPTGHQSGFMIYNAYYNAPYQRGFIPYNPMPGRQYIQGSR
jgi:hypothetical protein